MRPAKPGKLLAVGLLGMPMAGTAFADPGAAPPPRPGSTSVLSQMFGRKPSDATVTRTDSAKPTRPPPKPPVDPIAKARDKELANWLRRTDVCLKLMEVADQTGDEALRKKAQELDRRARTAYERRIAAGRRNRRDDFDIDGSRRNTDTTRSRACFAATARRKGARNETGLYLMLALSTACFSLPFVTKEDRPQPWCSVPSDAGQVKETNA